MLTVEHLLEPFPHVILQNFIPNVGISNEILAEVNNLRGSAPMLSKHTINLNKAYALDQGRTSTMIRMADYFTRTWADKEQRSKFSYLNYFDIAQHELYLTIYSRSGSFESHYDPSVLTVIYTFWKTPHDPGGYLEFPDFQYQPLIGANSIIMFPSWAKWRIEPVNREADMSRIDLIQLCNLNHGDPIR